MQVRLTLDTHGIPGVWAEDAPSAFFGLGAVHGLHRPLQSLLLPHAGAGRLMARLAPVAALSHLDTTAHRLDLPARGRAVAARLDGVARARVEAYLGGLAFGLARGRFSAGTRAVVRLLGAPSPDDLCAGFLLSAYLGLAEGQERMERLLIEAVGQGADPRLLEAMFAPHLQGWAPERLRGLAPRRPAPGFAAHALAGVGGSNAWAVRGHRSASGAPMLAGDPHLQINQLPSLFYPVRVRLPDDYWIGASIPGLPGLAVGRNRNVAWSGTFAVADNVDFFLEPPEVARAGAVREAEVRRRGLPPLALRFVETERGQLETPDAPGASLSTRWSGPEDAHEAMQSYLRLPFARSAAEADEILADAHTLSLHFVLADRADDVRYRQVGRIPRRSEGWSGLWPAGAGGPKWQGTFRAGELAGARAEAWVASANEARPGPGGATLSTLSQPSYRRDRICGWLEGRARHDLASMQDLQRDLWSGQAARLRPGLLAALPEGPLSRALAAWDLVSAPDRTGAHAFAIAYRAALSALATDLGGAWFEDALERSEVSVWWATALDRALEGIEAWPAARKRALGARLLAVAEVDPSPWGQVQQLRLPHLVFGGLPDALGLDRGPAPLPGDISTVCQGNLLRLGDAEVAVGPALRFVTDLSQDEAQMAWPGGVDGRPASGSYDAMLGGYLAGEYLTVRPPEPGEPTWLIAARG